MDKVNHNGAISRTAGKNNAVYLVAGWISAIAALVRYPYIFGVAGIIMGVLLSKSGGKSGMPLIAASIIFMAAGLIFSEVFYNYLRHAFGMT